jgi:hypothetical protein
MDRIARTALAIAACIARRCVAAVLDRGSDAPSDVGRDGEPVGLTWIMACGQYPSHAAASTRIGVPLRRPIEWRLITATHNLLKLHTHQLATAAP